MRPADQTVLVRLSTQQTTCLGSPHVAERQWKMAKPSQIKTFLGPHGICLALLNFVHTIMLQPDSLQSGGESKQGRDCSSFGSTAARVSIQALRDVQ